MAPYLPYFMSMPRRWHLNKFLYFDPNSVSQCLTTYWGLPLTQTCSLNMPEDLLGLWLTLTRWLHHALGLWVNCSLRHPLTYLGLSTPYLGLQLVPYNSALQLCPLRRAFTVPWTLFLRGWPVCCSSAHPFSLTQHLDYTQSFGL